MPLSRICSMMLFSWFCSLLALPVFSAVPIAENSRPLAEIIVGNKPAEPVAFAAKELAFWIREISGAALPIRTTRGSAPAAVILEVAPETGLRADGFVIRETGNTIRITAARPRGVLSGVYRLLFENTDIIWARPNTDFGTVFSKRPSLTFTKTDLKYDPDMSCGFQFALPPIERCNELWQVRNGSTWSYHSTLDGKIVRDLYDSGYILYGHHNLVRVFLPEKKYWKTHPEFYPLMKGRRVRPSERGEHLTNLCFTSQACLNEFTNVLFGLIEKNPEFDTVGIMQEDNFDACECAECMKDIVLPDGKKITPKTKNFRSTQFFLWLNQIAVRLKEKYPDKKIKTIAYYLTEPAPACRVENNIVISFCPVFKNSKFPIQSPENRSSLEKLDSWCKTGVSVTWREYYGNTGVFPRPIDAVAAKEFQFVSRKYGIQDTYSSMPSDRDTRWRPGKKIWDQNCLYFWVLAHGPGDLSKPVSEWRREFLKRVYGEAAPDVGEYYALLEKAWLKAHTPSFWYDVDYAVWQECFDTVPGLKEKLRAALARAEKKKIPANGKIFLQRLKDTFESMSDPRRRVVKTLRVSSVPVFDPDFASGDWAKAPAVSDFRMMSKTGRPDQEKTLMKVLYDDQNFYIGIKCFDRNGKKVFSGKSPKSRDFWTLGNKIEILTKTADGKRLQLAVDSNGKIFDRMDTDAAWEGFFDIPVRKTESGWSTMITLPYAFCGYRIKPEIFRFLCIRYYVKNTDGSNSDRAAMQLFSDNAYESRYPFGYPVLE